MDAEVYIGTSGWSYPDWDGIVYPKNEKDKLRFVSQYVNCVEINTTFYHPIKYNVAEKWTNTVKQNHNFRFAVKAWKKFTHDKMPYTKTDVNVFKQGIVPLMEQANEKLWLLFQFPFYFECNQALLDRIKKLLDDFSDCRCIVEVRHKSFDNDAFYGLINSASATICHLDYPLSEVSFNPTVSASDLVYFRLHGRNYKEWFKKGALRDDKYNYLYGRKDMQDIISKVKRLIGYARTLVVVANNHYKGQAFVNALELSSKLGDKKVDVPELLKVQYPQLSNIATNNKTVQVYDDDNGDDAQLLLFSR